MKAASYTGAGDTLTVLVITMMQMMKWSVSIDIDRGVHLPPFHPGHCPTRNHRHGHLHFELGLGKGSDVSGCDFLGTGVRGGYVMSYTFSIDNRCFVCGGRRCCCSELPADVFN